MLNVEFRHRLYSILTLKFVVKNYFTKILKECAELHRESLITEPVIHQSIEISRGIFGTPRGVRLYIQLPNG